MQGQTDTIMPWDNGVKCNSEQMTGRVSPVGEGKHFQGWNSQCKGTAVGMCGWSEEQLGGPPGDGWEVRSEGPGKWGHEGF